MRSINRIFQARGKIETAGFRIDDTGHGYVEGPRILSYTYRGSARVR